MELVASGQEIEAIKATRVGHNNDNAATNVQPSLLT